jgi:hypothetical protein
VYAPTGKQEKTGSIKVTAATQLATPIKPIFSFTD